MSRKKEKSESKAEEVQETLGSTPAEQQQSEDTTTKLSSLQAERDDLLARLQRVSADYLNYQKRVQKEISQAREFANEELIKALLSVLDDMERALAHARENHGQDDPLLQGMQLVHDKTLETLSKFGLSRIEAKGKKFDPQKHSAMMQEATDECPPMTVLRELQKGYELRGRVLRPSAVVVSTPPEPQEARQDQREERTETPDDNHSDRVAGKG